MEIFVDVKNNKIAVKTFFADRIGGLSLDRQLIRIMPGDKFIRSGKVELVIGFSDDDGEALPPYKFMWTLARGEEKLGVYSMKGHDVEHIGKIILKAKKSMTAETAEETIRSFQSKCKKPLNKTVEI